MRPTTRAPAASRVWVSSLLHRVGGVHVAGADEVTHRRTRHTRAGRVEQATGGIGSHPTNLRDPWWTGKVVPMPMPVIHSGTGS